ncbi:MAG: carbon-nitrogen hydrolase family protein, partial [Pseudomonadota bacterium]
MRLTLMQRAPVSGGAEEALSAIETAALEAAAGGSDLLITPEMFLSGYAIGAEAVRGAAAAPDARPWTGVAEIATRHGLTIIAGGPLLREGVVFNAALAFSPARLLATYAKLQLFGEVDRSQFAAGDALSPVFDVAGWRVALAICYDVEFPEIPRRLALAGAELIAIPTANMHPFTSVCTRLVPARAEENGLAIAYANYVGREGPFDYCGLSCVAGPDGEDRARAGEDPTLLHATLDRAHLAEIRKRTPYLTDLRRDLFGP